MTKLRRKSNELGTYRIFSPGKFELVGQIGIVATSLLMLAQYYLKRLKKACLHNHKHVQPWQFALKLPLKRETLRVEFRQIQLVVFRSLTRQGRLFYTVHQRWCLFLHLSDVIFMLSLNAAAFGTVYRNTSSLNLIYPSMKVEFTTMES